MTQQKIPLFDGLIKACHDSTTSTPALTPIFTPPDKTLLPGSQAYYALHLWLKPAKPGGAPGNNVGYGLAAYRGSNLTDKHVIWASSSLTLRQVTGLSTSPTQVSASSGVPVKILDGYVVRGDVIVELQSLNAASDSFASSDGTKIWGFYQRIGAENEGYRFIGDPPAGPLFDTGLPTLIGAGETKVLHTFQPDRIDEIYLEIINAVADQTPAVLLTLSDSLVPGGTALSALNFAIDQSVFGAPNPIRDPASPYDFYGVFGNNPTLKTLQVTNNNSGAAPSSIYVHGRFARH